ncbi:tRNA-dihydrouridine synthase [bacterium]|nr:tRNA-dihydrouridine synthase [bacterium]
MPTKLAGDGKRIAGIALASPWILAPIAGYTDWPFQLLCRQRGLTLTFTPMICAQALAFLSSRSATLKLLDWDRSCGPVAVQIFGSDPQYMASAAKAVADLGADLIDINMGCTVPKIVKKGAGAALLKHPDIACRVAEAVCGAVGVPVTVKMRLGYRCGDGLGLALARRLQDLGVAAFFLHGRYAEQGFSGRADGEAVRLWQNSLRLPVVGNGDIVDGPSAQRMQVTSESPVMIGRGLLGDPWLLERLDAWKNGREVPNPPSMEQAVATIAVHLHLVQRYSKHTELQSVQSFRSHLSQYCRKHRCLQPWRQQLLAQRDYAGLEGLLRAIERH